MRVFKTAATLVLGPIFEADLPPEQFACQLGRNAQQAAVEVEELLFRGRGDVVDACKRRSKNPSLKRPGGPVGPE
jgi:RNA-directed DNA polymerase